MKGLTVTVAPTDNGVLFRDLPNGCAFRLGGVDAIYLKVNRNIGTVNAIIVSGQADMPCTAEIARTYICYPAESTELIIKF